MNAEQLLAHFETVSEAPDAVARLRRLILDLAVSGKLVPQDKLDEPASDLLKRIRTERARLSSLGEIRKTKSLRIVSETPFDVPLDWSWVCIRDVTSDRGQEIPSGPFTYIDVSSVDNKRGVVSAPQVLSAADAPSRARKATRLNDVIYSCVRPYLLNVAIITDNFDPPAIASTAFAVLNGYGLVVPRYLWLVLRSPFMVGYVESAQRGQAYPAINDADFALLPFPLPPLSEQHRIVARVEELMALCDRLETQQKEREACRDRLTVASFARLSAANPKIVSKDTRFVLDALPAFTARQDQIRQLREMVLSIAVRGKLVPQNARDETASSLIRRAGAAIANYAKLNRIGRSPNQPILEELAPFPAPEGWQWARLGALFHVITDGDHQPPPRADEGVAFLTIGNITTGRIDFTDCRKVSDAYFDSLPPYRTPAKGDILYTVVGATYGRPALVETDRPFCVQRHIAILKPVTELDPRFLIWWLKSPLIYDQATSSTTGSAQPTVGLRLLRDFLVPVPPADEQRRIVAKLEEIMAVCTQLESSLHDDRETRESFLSAVIARIFDGADERKSEAA